MAEAGSRYNIVAIAFHWVTAALIVAMVWLGLTMEDLPLGPEKIETYNLHKSIGFTVLVLTLLRLLWRLLSPPPPLPMTMPAWERRAARASHGALYVLLIAQPLVGIAHSWAAKFPIVIYDSFTLPVLIGPSDSLKEFLEGLHALGALALILLVAVHVAAALRHHFLLRHDILWRMLPVVRRPAPPETPR